MATTTNYSWTTPDDTALVKDGASAIRSLGTAIDTTTKNLNPSTTLGDIEYRSSTANTNTRLAIGSTGNVLTVAGGVPTWAAPASGGGMTLLSTTSLTGSSVDITTISGSYTDLVAILTDVYMNDQSGYMALRFNSITTGNYNYNTRQIAGTDTYLNYDQSGTYYALTAKTDQTTARFKTAGIITMPRYASALTKFANHTMVNSITGSSQQFYNGACNFETTSAISTLTFYVSAGTFSGGTVYLYGVN